MTHSNRSSWSWRGAFFAALATLSVTAIDARSEAEAFSEAPWCANYWGRSGGSTNCGFYNQFQCLATVSGVGGHCAPNPRFAYYDPALERRPYKKRKVRHHR